jgi:NAD-dependent deacetylase
MKKIVVLTGAGISAESGIKTFRDSGGLWEGFDMMSVASPQGWQKNKELVLDFYNQRRKQLATVSPNIAHLALAELEKHFYVVIVTQNVDDLHERAGSTNIIHLHGKLTEARSTLDEKLTYEIGHREIKLGNKCAKGSQLRPNIVWFGEEVPSMIPASEEVKEADIFIIIGTSLQVYPAAQLIDFVPSSSTKYLIDPHIPVHINDKSIVIIPKKATDAVPSLVNQLILARK